MSQAGVAHSFYRIGQLVRRSSFYPSAKIKVSRMKLDKYLLMYFAESKHCWAETKDLKCDVGDIVLIKAMNQETYPRTTFEIVDVIFKEGEVRDPITGRRCRSRQFIDETKRAEEQKKISEITG
ncbi:hypothetical protein CHS0354_018158 [Potamilus streckersoni]|uniref:Ribosomal protein S17 n=1 Tax=Potamilus streckersoni TaxID=2493646 RepID=A0AAE0ST42_9BIVA|nr:hypothetical protein CHS0354_018158 [Potamilus streckersoni]